MLEISFVILANKSTSRKIKINYFNEDFEQKNILF